jgi:4-amino-4-deoxy-L-arabinose transferase-like glycosyltransferase
MRYTALAQVFRTDRRYVVAWSMILIAVAVRVGWAAWVAHAHPEAVMSGDTPGYLGPAEALIDSGRFDVSPRDGTPMFFRTPGYPAFLAAILWVTDSTWSISPIQAALSLLTILLVVFIGHRVISPAAGVVAGVLVALDPLQFASSGTILTESLFTLMLVGGIAAGIPVLLRPEQQVRPIHLAALGAVIAIATMVRPTTYYLPIVVLVLLAVRFWNLAWRSTLALLIAFALPIALVVGGWMVRNYDEVGSWQLSGSAAITLYCWHGAEVEARDSGVSMQEARKQLQCPPGGWDDLRTVCPSWWACDADQPLADGASWDEMGDRGIDILTDHPFLTAEMFIRGLAREVAGPGTDTVGRFLHVDSSPALFGLLLLWNLLLWSLALVGAVVGLRSPQRWFWGFVVTIVVYVLVVSAGANSGARFRTPLVPLLALLAALGIRHLVKAWRQRISVPGSMQPSPALHHRADEPCAP